MVQHRDHLGDVAHLQMVGDSGRHRAGLSLFRWQLGSRIFGHFASSPLCFARDAMEILHSRPSRRGGTERHAYDVVVRRVVSALVVGDADCFVPLVPSRAGMWAS